MQVAKPKQSKGPRGRGSSFAFDGVEANDKQKQNRLSLLAQRERDKLEGANGKKEFNVECGGRFKEVLQELVAEHTRELTAQRAAFEEQMRLLRMGAPLVPTSDLCTRLSAATAIVEHSDLLPSGILQIPGSVPDKAVLSHRSSVTESVLSETRAPPRHSIGATPRAPTEPPPVLSTSTSEPLPVVPQSSGHHLLERGEETPTALAQSPHQLSIEVHPQGYRPRDTFTMYDHGSSIEEEAGGADQDLCEEDLPPGGRHAKHMNGVAAKWANLVIFAINVASVDMHFPRQVWKDGLHSKHRAKEQLAHTASKHLKKMWSNLSQSQPDTMRTGKMAMQDIVFNFVEGMHDSTKCEALDPHTGPRLGWTVVAFVFMLYDLLYVPMQLFDPPYNFGFFLIDLAAQVYWTLDIFMCFVTGVYVKSMLEKRFTVIARIYARSWLTFDLLVTLPQWYSLLVGQKSPLANLKGIRFVRMLRFLRLARLAKFEHVLREALEVINSPYVLLIIGIIKLMLCLIWFNHVICCIWFHIGSGGDGWVDRGGLNEASIWYQYLSSIHWALTQFQGTSEIVPGTTAERGYAVAFLLMALILMAVFVSSLTNNMRALKELHNEKNSQQRAVRNYLSENGISTSLCVQVNRYIEWHRRQQHRKQQDAEVLLILPTKLLMDLYDEVRGPLLAAHPFFLTFRQNFIRVQRRVCYEALDQLSPCPSELVYAEGDECSCMYFIMCGQLRYEPHPAALGRVQNNKLSHSWEEEFDMEDTQVLDNVLESTLFRAIRLGENEWLSEPVLWTEWEHCGDLIGLEECALLSLDAGRFSSIVRTFMAARTMVSLYARNFVVCLNRFGHTFTDVIDHVDLFNFEDTDVALGRHLGSSETLDTVVKSQGVGDSWDFSTLRLMT